MSVTALALDTCGSRASVALVQDRVVVRTALIGERMAGAHLLTAVEEVLNSARLADIDAIIVVRGPGSFTGMRIGLSTAKGLAEAGGRPVVAVSRLAILLDAAGAAAAALYAGRGRLYLATTGEGGGSYGESLVTSEEARAMVQGLAVVVCEPKAAALLGDQAQSFPEPGAPEAAAFAWSRVLAKDWDDPAALDAHYLWRAGDMLSGASRNES